MRVTHLNIYPIKSCQGYSVSNTTVATTGFDFDREFALINEDGEVLTQQDVPHLATLQVTKIPHRQKIALTYQDNPSIMIDTTEYNGNIILPQWRISGFDLGDKAAKWFQKHLHVKARLVKLNKVSLTANDNRSVHMLYVNGVAPTLIARSSLLALNDELPNLIAEHFRAAIVVDETSPAFAENDWQEISIGKENKFVRYKVIGPAEIPYSAAVDRETGWFDQKRFQQIKNVCTRLSKGHATFGLKLAPCEKGDIHEDDPVTVLAYRRPDMQRVA